MLQTPVEKSDAWRYHVLCGHGGIYADTDTVCAKSFEGWSPLGGLNSTGAARLVVGVENMFHSQEVRLSQQAGFCCIVIVHTFLFKVPQRNVKVSATCTMVCQAAASGQKSHLFWHCCLQAAQEASYVHKIQMVQWTMASTRAHPVVCRMGLAIKDIVEQEVTAGNKLEQEMGHDAAILLRTGPGVWSTQVLRIQYASIVHLSSLHAAAG